MFPRSRRSVVTLTQVSSHNLLPLPLAPPLIILFFPLPRRDGEVVNVIVAFAVIVFIFRWVTSGMWTLKWWSTVDLPGFHPGFCDAEMLCVF